ncbi:hypothetical protein HBI56_018100 [Parastagonospora nodorum]|nr:hypothetical protein HBH56_081890 [Parastagonospora nodorum]QRC96621.1 hypothetical protein JI435_433910 [Parastagonospora nodorum SN15]KAH3929648.1 hypothetical protein HBH54_119950 [Parastagonospora nodorum]KAH3955771.1 hypothetical protein HBH53_004640 [Parastagonospora nodorum]KAH3976713.1 hypothetical protein HBH51_076900 [Parastagonospora nodorum]
MLHGSSAGFLSQLLTFVRPFATPSYAVDVSMPDTSHLLKDIENSTPKREDVARWLLDFGAKTQRKLLQGVTKPSPDRPRSDLQLDYSNANLLFTTLQKAAESGTQKIICLLLERGADPVSA